MFSQEPKYNKSDLRIKKKKERNKLDFSPWRPLPQIETNQEI